MNIITVTAENLEREHICCAISNNTDCQVMSKKQWMREAIKDGLVFKKCDVRGKCFIEYIPAENAWAPINADGYMYINCLWVSGQFKGQGYSNLLLDECIADSKAKGKAGLVMLSGKKKYGFLSDPKYLCYKGFKVADNASPYFELMYLPFEESATKPSFREQVKNPQNLPEGFALYYTNQCPFTAKYVPVIENIAKGRGVPFKAVRYSSASEAQNGPSPFSTYSIYFNGKFLTHEILSDKKFEKILSDNGF